MKSHESRSPEKIREYFELLKWHRKGGEVNLSQDILNSDSILNNIQILLEVDQAKLFSLNSKILSLEDSTKSIDEDICNVEQECISIGREIRVRPSNIKEKRRNQDSYNRNQHSAFSKPKLLLSKIIQDLVSSIFKDLVSFFQSIKEHPLVTRFNVLTCLSVYIAFVFVVSIICGLALNFSLIDNLFFIYFIVLAATFITFLCYLIDYVNTKIEFIRNSDERLWKLKVSKSIMENSRIPSKKISFSHPKDLGDGEELLKLRYSELISFKEKIVSRKQGIDNQIYDLRRDIVIVCESIQKNPELREARIEQIRKRELDKKYEYLSNLQAHVQKWLNSDIERLTRKAMKKANILPYRSSGDPNVLKFDLPIRILVDVQDKKTLTENSDKVLIFESDSEINLSKSKSKISIHEKDFLSAVEYSFVSRKKYGVYEFITIFLCENFITYYKCYFNFVRGIPVDEETCEYMYDSIVSVKVQDKSSANSTDENRKITSTKRLVITLNDGKVIRLQLEASRRLDSSNSLCLSTIDEVAQSIRSMLRRSRRDRMDNGE